MESCMAEKQYMVGKEQISTILGLVKGNRIAIPEIQRPFVWQSTQVRDLIDSLYRSFPVGYIIVWKNADTRVKNIDTTIIPDVIIDGQQRITSLTAALMGQTIVNKQYQKIRIKIAFNPIDEKFETLTPAIEKNPLWIPDISVLFNGEKNSWSLHKEYMQRNADKGLDEQQVGENIMALESIKNSEIGTITLNPDLDIEVVAEIFKRINSKGTPLDQYDFVMSKIASKEAYDGVNIRKTIDYFCHIAKNKADYDTLVQDKEFSETPAFAKLSWIKNKNIGIYSPEYKDVIRVAFTHKFERGKLNDLVLLLSGRNFEKRSWDEEISKQSFATFSDGINNFINKTYFERFLMIIESLGFIDENMISSKTAINFAHSLYLYLKTNVGMEDVQIEKYVQKWFVLSLLTSRYLSSAETHIDEDIKRIKEKGVDVALREMEQNNLSDNFWEYAVPHALETTKDNTAFPALYLASLCKGKNKGFLSKNITVYDMIKRRGDVHHIYPKAYLMKNRYSQTMYNQFANFVYCETPINIKIGEKEPAQYLQEVVDNMGTEQAKLSGITTLPALKENFIECDIPEIVLTGTVENYEEFLATRRNLMAIRIKNYWESL